MNVHSATCSCSIELYKQWFTLADFFPKLEFSRGFLSAAVMAGDIIFFCLAGPLGDYTGAHTVILRWLFSIYYSPEKTEKLRWAGRVGGGGGNIVFFSVPNSFEGFDGWGEGRGILFIKASLVQWKDTLLADGCAQGTGAHARLITV